MKVETGIPLLARRLLEREAEQRPQRLRPAPLVDLRTPKLSPVGAWGGWVLDVQGARLVNTTDHLQVDLVAVGRDPSQLWTATTHALELDQLDVLRALVTLFPSCAVCRPNRLSPGEIEARVAAYVLGRAPVVTFHGGPIRQEG